MAAVVRLIQVDLTTTRASVWLGNWRQVLVTFQRSPELVFGIWARDRGDNHYHCYPGPHLREDFFTPQEAAILVGGVHEIALNLAGRELDADLFQRTLGALTIVLEAAANGIPEETAAPA